MLQATVGNGLSLDPFSFGQDGWTASEVDVGRGEIVERFVIASMIVVVDEAFDGMLEMARQIVVLEQDTALQ